MSLIQGEVYVSLVQVGLFLSMCREGGKAEGILRVHCNQAEIHIWLDEREP